MRTSKQKLKPNILKLHMKTQRTRTYKSTEPEQQEWTDALSLKVEVTT